MENRKTKNRDCITFDEWTAELERVVADGQAKGDKALANLGRNLQQGLQGQLPTRGLKSSKYKGIYWAKRDRVWGVGIRNCTKLNWLGSFRNEKEAALAYDKAALKLWGEYARTNQMMFPEDFSP